MLVDGDADSANRNLEFLYRAQFIGRLSSTWPFLHSKKNVIYRVHKSVTGTQCVKSERKHKREAGQSQFRDGGGTKI